MKDLPTADAPITERGDRPKESQVKINLDKVFRVLEDIRKGRKDGQTYEETLERRCDFLRTMLFDLSSAVSPADWDAAIKEGKKALDRAQK